MVKKALLKGPETLAKSQPLPLSSTQPMMQKFLASSMERPRAVRS